MSTRTPQELHETYLLLHQTTPAWIAWNRTYQLLQDYKTYRPTTTRLHETTLNCSLESTWRSFQLIQPGPEQKGCQKETDLWLIYSLFPKWKTSQLYAALIDAAPTNEKHTCKVLCCFDRVAFIKTMRIPCPKSKRELVSHWLPCLFSARKSWASQSHCCVPLDLESARSLAKCPLTKSSMRPSNWKTQVAFWVFRCQKFRALQIQAYISYLFQDVGRPIP